MPESHVSAHALDVILKLEAAQLATALSSYFGLPVAPIARAYPVELPQLDLHIERLDRVFELIDGRLLHLEFQSDYREETLLRLLLYDMALIRAEQRAVQTVVFYGPRVRRTPGVLDYGAVRYTVTNVYLGGRDGAATLQHLQARVARGEALGEHERLDLVFLPLMAHQRPLEEVVTEALMLARHLPEAQQPQAMGTLLGLAYHYMGADVLDRLMEGLMATNLLQQVLEQSLEQGLAQGREQGLAQGREQGLAQAKRDAVLKVLTTRFGHVPSALEQRISAQADLERLDALFDLALTAPSLDVIAQTLDTPPATP